MPAPTPIQIRYGGDPAALGGLALATGTARRKYADYQSQLASDRSFLQNELSRRTEDTRFRNNFNLSLLGMQANERAARAQATALQEASGFNQRQLAQAGGVTAPGRVGQPISLVPAEGPIDGTQPGGGGSITFRDSSGVGPFARYDLQDGEITRFGGGELSSEQLGGYVRGEQQQGIPRDRRSALEYIKVLRGTIPEDQWNSMWVAVQQGALDPSDVPKLVDDIRSGSGGSGFDPGKLPVRRAQTDAFEMRKIEELPDPEVQEEAMLIQLGYKPGTREASWAKKRLPELWYRRWIAVDNMTAKGGSQGMLGSSSTNPVSVDQPGDEDSLPPGTWFQVPDGRVFRR